VCNLPTATSKKDTGVHAWRFTPGIDRGLQFTSTARDLAVCDASSSRITKAASWVSLLQSRLGKCTDNYPTREELPPAGSGLRQAYLRCRARNTDRPGTRLTGARPRKKP